VRLFPTVLVLLAAAAQPAGGRTLPQPLGPLWTNGAAAIEVTACTPSPEHDAYCRGIALRRGSRLERVGEGYLTVELLWTRTHAGSGPALFVRGLSGGSGGDGDLFAIDPASRTGVRKLSWSRADTVAVRRDPTRLRFEAPFVVGFFNGAPHAGDTLVPLPLVWAGGAFRLDLAALTARRWPAAEIDFRRLAMREELSRWAEDAYPADRLYPPEASSGTELTAKTLADLILTGHGDLAHTLLDEAWPRSQVRDGGKIGGMEAFWSGLCAAIVRNQAWRSFGLDRVPHASLVLAGAARAQRAPA
jgi:hypothetical protein